MIKTTFLVLASLLLPSSLFAQSAPNPPCAGRPVPPYASIGRDPNVQVWNGAVLGKWTPPCLEWNAASSNLIIAAAGTISGKNTADELLARFGAISALSGIRYWSVTDNAWRVLVSEAAAVEDATNRKRRGDFSSDELTSGGVFHFAQKDTRSTGEVIYRMRVRKPDNNHFIVELENVTPVRAFIITLFNPGEMKFTYFFDRDRDGAWHSYLLLSANGSHASGNEKSFINRVAAFYRFYAGVPTDESPPMAR